MASEPCLVTCIAFHGSSLLNYSRVPKSDQNTDFSKTTPSASYRAESGQCIYITVPAGEGEAALSPEAP